MGQGMDTEAWGGQGELIQQDMLNKYMQEVRNKEDFRWHPGFELDE